MKEEEGEGETPDYTIMTAMHEIQHHFTSLQHHADTRHIVTDIVSIRIVKTLDMTWKRVSEFMRNTQMLRIANIRDVYATHTHTHTHRHVFTPPTEL